MGRFIKLAAPDEPPEEDPLAGVANLFDASIVFIVGLMITLFSVYNMGDLMSGEGSVTMVKTDENGMQEIIVKEGETITAYRVTGEEGTGDGERLGSAYRLANGQIIYVPDSGDGSPADMPGTDGNDAAP
ncbi:hypothetical protein FHS61_000645 [Altererythrobacter atlanticus]|uniref:Uncharacterized protein n=1 Tax=Croceibacterium atlanticum TaxID=1267766 RepID=A0A0F7KUF1_9SPHN|nr:DUF2149 domain-containing protein [Croceibacterium atlanticum]AKH42872.1 hypothetical protein WYH_01836 [Croceibacterium atlanticum]MBB5731652.1 hypothetical protein [Croceibacterium atlanticum]